MRVIAGSARGVRLCAPVGNDARPPLDLMKGAVFSILGERVIGARVLDLYAGSGSLGIEALSRGAARAVFIERSIKCLRALEENLARTKLEERAVVTKGEVLALLPVLAGRPDRFDVAFVDPPFADGREFAARGWPPSIGETLPALLAAGGVAVFRLEAGAAPPPLLGSAPLSKSRTHGRSTAAFYGL